MFVDSTMLETAERRAITLLNVADQCRQMSCDALGPAADDVFATPHLAPPHVVSGCDSGFSTSDTHGSGKRVAGGGGAGSKVSACTLTVTQHSV